MTTNRTMSSAYMEWVKTETDIPFNLANSGLKAYPFSGLQIDFSALTLSGPGAYGYGPLIKAIANKCRVDPDCVATAQGTSMANYLAMASILKPGDEVLMEQPVYPLLFEVAQFLGSTIRFFERPAAAGFAIETDLVERRISSNTRLIVITNLHNPSCAFAGEATLRRLGDLARSVRAHVLVDEVYLDLLFEDASSTSFKIGPEFIVTNSLTKVYGLSGLRCGWVLAKPDLVRKIYRLNDLLYVNAPYVTDQLSCVALAQLDRISQWSRKTLDKNQALAREFIAQNQRMDWDQPRMGTVLFPRIHAPVDEFCRILREEYETVVTPGHFFGSPDRVRIGIGGETSLLQEGLSRISAAYQAVLAAARVPLSSRFS